MTEPSAIINVLSFTFRVCPFNIALSSLNSIFISSDQIYIDVINMRYKPKINILKELKAILPCLWVAVT